jgi:hypothetical protein
LPVPSPELPQWEGKMFVKRICPRKIADCFDIDKDDLIDEKPIFVAQVACDGEGSRIFQDEDVLFLTTSEYLQSLVERFYWAGRAHNGLTEDNHRAWRKNLPSTGGGGSPSSCAAQSIPDTAST